MNFYFYPVQVVCAAAKAGEESPANIERQPSNRKGLLAVTVSDTERGHRNKTTFRTSSRAKPCVKKKGRVKRWVRAHARLWQQGHGKPMGWKDYRPRASAARAGSSPISVGHGDSEAGRFDGSDWKSGTRLMARILLEETEPAYRLAPFLPIFETPVKNSDYRWRESHSEILSWDLEYEKIPLFQSQRWRRRPSPKIKEEDFWTLGCAISKCQKWMAIESFREQAKPLDRPPQFIMISAHGSKRLLLRLPRKARFHPKPRRFWNKVAADSSQCLKQKRIGTRN